MYRLNCADAQDGLAFLSHMHEQSFLKMRLINEGCPANSWATRTSFSNALSLPMTVNLNNVIVTFGEKTGQAHHFFKGHH